ncbi:heterokaryon incompatibility protein-domain-containing protein, partial [Usnea florida]
MVDFEYERLTGPADFRLLRLEPGQGAEPLVCSLLLSSLDDSSYNWTALSYTWGNPRDCRDIICDGSRLPITKNLHSALQRLRLADKPLLLWADAVCINQRDNEEKEAQVQLMRRIYKMAYLVVADLGEAGDDYDDVAAVFNAL